MSAINRTSVYGFFYFSFTYFGKAFRGLAGNVCV